MMQREQRELKELGTELMELIRICHYDCGGYKDKIRKTRVSSSLDVTQVHPQTVISG